jgi:predicted RNA-binding Zn-ribbon protein involved in translation (DUF1610 family)
MKNKLKFSSREIISEKEIVNEYNCPVCGSNNCMIQNSQYGVNKYECANCGYKFSNRVKIASTENSKKIYGQGNCDVYAIALHRLFKYPLCVVRGFYKDDWDDEIAYEDSHMFVKIDKNNGMDIRGKRPISEIILDCAFVNKIEKIKTPIISEEEARNIFTMDGVTEEQINIATKEICKKLKEV